jgi:glutamate racemase
MSEDKNVLGVIRPTAEVIGRYSKTGHIGILGTNGTVKSESYLIEIEKFFPNTTVFQQACPLWVPLIENGECNTEGAAFFIKKDLESLLNQSSQIDTILLGCTHYPLLVETIKKYLPEEIKVISQGKIVAESLQDYLTRHPEMESRCSKNGILQFFTTDSTEDFDKHSKIFFGQKVNSKHIEL